MDVPCRTEFKLIGESIFMFGPTSDRMRKSAFRIGSTGAIFLQTANICAVESRTAEFTAFNSTISVRHFADLQALDPSIQQNRHTLLNWRWHILHFVQVEIHFSQKKGRNMLENYLKYEGQLTSGRRSLYTLADRCYCSYKTYQTKTPLNEVKI